MFVLCFRVAVGDSSVYRYFIWKHFPVYFMVEQTPWQKGQIEQVVRVVCIVFCSVPASLSAFCMIP